MDFRRLKYYRHNSLILIVSSDRALVSSISKLLSEDKYNFLTASSGEEAWEIILQKNPAIVLADWSISDISGIALCHRVKASVEHSELLTTYFILIVESINSNQRQVGLETGVDEFLATPIEPSELVTRLRTAIRINALMQSLIWANQRLLAQRDLLDALALSDPLTKTLSEQTFVEIIPRIMRQFKGLGSYKSYSFLSVLLIDIDNFKQITQAYGEQIGNETIKAIAGRLTHSCAANSLIYRYGLDEFVCVTPHTDAYGGRLLASELLASIRSHPFAISSGLVFPLTISIGGVVSSLENNKAPHDESDMGFGELVSLAERSLIQAQKSGGDRAIIEEIKIS